MRINIIRGEINMPTKKLTSWQQSNPLMPRNPDKDTKYRILRFLTWLREHNYSWTKPDLAAYRDYLLQDHTPHTVAAHLSTIRGQYRRFLSSDTAVRELLLDMWPSGSNKNEVNNFTENAIVRLRDAINPASSKVNKSLHRDRTDSSHLRLTRKQAEALINTPGVDTLRGLRDTAMIALLLCTGIRERELVNLDVEDLRQHLGNELALHVQQGKGAKERLIVYGALDWCLAIVDAWLKAAEIRSGPVFRSYYPSFKQQRGGRMSERTVERIIAAYPINVGGKLVTVHPYDLRRTYARRLHEAHMPTAAIQQNLGHATSKTTNGYIGEMDVASRKPVAVYSFDLGKLSHEGDE
jgi:integrase